MSRLILASASPRRKEILERIGLEFEICPAKGEELTDALTPEETVLSLSRNKAKEVAAGILTYNETHKELVTPQDLLVVAADTVVAYGDEILGKPVDEKDAKRMILMLSGKVHSVYTGVTLLFMDSSGRTGIHSFFEKTDVEVYPLEEEEINAYVATQEPYDKAGGYGIQGKFSAYVKGIRGDYNNVVGFPLARFCRELKKLGVNIREYML